MRPEEDLIQQRLKKLEEIKKLGINPYPYKYEPNAHAAEVLDKYQSLGKEEKKEVSLKLAGRVMTLREMGKASFAHLQDESGKIQFYIREDVVGPENYKLFKLLDLGDYAGISGSIFRTKMGEITVMCKELTLLAKSTRPLPEKWHGLKDVEQRYRKRHLDMIFNREVLETFKKRSIAIDTMREILKKSKFLEVDTPVLQKLYGGAYARPFKTFLHELKLDVYMRISDELYLKRLVAGGIEKVFEIGRVFRNESIDKTHNPEFTIMECYASYWDYNDVMRFTEDMITEIAKKITGTTKFNYQGKEIDMKKPWMRITMLDAIKEYAKIDITKLSDDELKEIIENNSIEFRSDFTRGIAIQRIFEELVEDKLIQPTFIIDHMKESTPLCKPHRKNPDQIERFELYINGMEMANAYSELNNPILQRKILEGQSEGKPVEESNPVDEEFLEAMEHGMPPMGGLGIGVDRLVMLLTDSASIKDVIPFPFMK